MTETAISPLRRHAVTYGGNLQSASCLLFVHGFGTDQSAWHAVSQAFAQDHALILMNNAGTRTAAPGGFQQHRYLNLHQYAQDVLDVCAALDRRSVTLVGHSAGAMIGILASLKQPKVFSKLILLGASPRYLDTVDYRGGMTEDDLRATYQAITLNYDAWADSFAPLMMGNPNHPNLARHLAQSLKTIPAEYALTALCAVLQSDYRQEIQQITHPTLILQTLEDAAVPIEVAQYLYTHIPGSQLRLINTQGHLPHISAPDAVIEAIRAFISPQQMP